MNIDETVKTYRQMNLTLTPLRGKDAYLKAWNKREYTDKEWQNWLAKGCNIGLVLGSRSQNIVCIDIDPRNGSAPWVAANQDVLDQCAIIEESGRGDGGLHLFFSDINAEFQKNCDIAEGVEFCRNKQVVIAPSVHPDTGNPYLKTKGDLSLYPFTITELPDSIKEKLRSIGVDQRREAQKPFETERDITEEERRILQENLRKHEPKGSRHTSIIGWTTDAVAAGMPDPEIKAMGEQWFLDHGREPQPMEMDNWIAFAKEKLASGESFISDNRIAPERFLDEDGSGDGFQPVTDPVDTKYVNQKWMDGITFNKMGTMVSSLYNVQRVLEVHPKFQGKLAFNEMTQAPIKYTDEGAMNFPWDNPADRYTWKSKFSVHDFAELHHWFSDPANQCSVEVATRDMQMAVSNISRDKIVHPIRDWLVDLKWDGTERLGTWLHKVTNCADSHYNNRMGELLVLSIVARIMKPGVKWDNCIILEGIQGNGKSTLCSTLAGEDDNFCDAHLDLKDQKSILEKTMGKMVVELAEVDQYLMSFSSSKLKAWLGMKTDIQRMAYAAEAIEVPRSFIVIGTTNEYEYLKDPTGERRYFPVKTGDSFFDIPWLIENREQLFAEALAIVKSKGEDNALLIDKSLTALQQEEHKTRKEGDSWEASVIEYLEKHKDAASHSISHIMAMGLFIDVNKQSNKEKSRVKKILDGLGFKYIRIRSGKGGRSTSGYVATEASPSYLRG